ncbi:MAG TPA: YceI family protein [Anaerolineaceae bacterium]|jgi:polyisoprenoid-binding protein YceI|nr:YceI family protein [Anaerolineaceae bacterium]HNS64795.1 YceI family protein [Anaerolineaceae bacterium]HNY99695.1 YceI family protein [Anaerolineaceae bacterium]HOD43662.1 YceI family protein [Anaerolineaceae bacterium]HOH19055.1 YceI family protein [Anaerolineaceae bacterium]
MSWQIDYAHSQIQFIVRHMMLSKVRGVFEKFQGTVAYDETNPANTLVQVAVETASINTREAQRDAHLRSADFFNSEVHPHMTFTGKRVELVDANHARLIGDLTIRDVTREIVLDVEYFGQTKSPWGTTNAGFAATAKINRKDWGLTWNQVLEAGGVLVAEEVEINIELELTKQ